MPLRTPRRRIAPRTRRRYRAIKEFLKRALGTTSDPDIKTCSTATTVEISVTDLKHKIVDIEDKLNKVSKHYQDLACLENSFRQEAENLVIELKNEPNSEKQNGSLIDLKTADTKVLYKTSDSQYKRSNVSDHKIKTKYHGIGKSMTTANLRYNEKESRPKTKCSHRGQPNLCTKYPRWDELHYGIEHQSTTSFHSLYDVGDHYHSKPGCSKHERRHPKQDNLELNSHIERKDRNKSKKIVEKSNKINEKRHSRNNRKKHEHPDLDQEFITNIIQRQYKPVLFGRRESDYSQFSAPVCRDYEYKIRRDEIQEGSELCSCCFDHCKKHRYKQLYNSDLSDMRSVCDARLYSSKKRHLHDYNNSEYYDIFPVKEKASPKSRRKFVEDHIQTHQYYKEVPPSPRTQRPRLNLKTYEQYENENYNNRRQRFRSKPEYKIKVEDEDSSENLQTNQTTHLQKIQIPKMQNTFPSRENVGTMSILEYTNTVNANNQSNNDTTLNTQTTDVSVDKTDKTLCEIKDILQSFLSELKKESFYNDNTNQTKKIDHQQQNESREKNIKLHSNSNEKSGCSFNNVGSCNIPPYLPPFPNPCCYPILPMCPMNCMQNGYIVPSPSYTCMACANTSIYPEKTPSNTINKIPEKINQSKETQELIREIHKFVIQSQKQDSCTEDHLSRNLQSRADKKILTTRSVGGHSKMSKHDARVGTPAMKCVSKSCEALGSRQYSDTFYTNASYSDTILEKLSAPPMQSSSESDVSTASLKKVKNNKLKKILHRTIGLWKKKKKDVIEEISESESIINCIPRPPPFRQNIINYNMHGQDFCHPPPNPEHRYHTSHLPHLPQKCCCQSDFNTLSPNGMYNEPRHGQHHASHIHRHNPTLSNYHPQYNEMPPQVPLCLKEIEVKSIGTQSVKGKKNSLLTKFSKKMQLPQQGETKPQKTPMPVKDKPAFNWKNFQEKIKQGNPEALDFTMKTQKQLAQGDMKLRNAMIKKLFYKRNPFSPRNLIVKTLLGKDPSSFGNPPKMYRPRMFL